MPSANDEDETLAIPVHRRLELASVCVQPFSKWSRRLLTYRKRKTDEEDTAIINATDGISDHITEGIPGLELGKGVGANADDLNLFRRRYFQGFKSKEELEADPSGISNRPNRAKAIHSLDEQEKRALLGAKGMDEDRDVG